MVQASADQEHGSELLRGPIPALGSFRASKKLTGASSPRPMLAHPSSSPSSPSGTADPPRSPDFTWTTSRRPMHLTSPTVGQHLMEDEAIRFAMIPAIKNKARPKSASVTAAAWKAYGSPSARGQQRPAPPADTMHPRPKANFMDGLPGRPSSVLTLGGGYQLPRPQSAPTQPKLTTRTPKQSRHAADITGGRMAESPAMSMPGHSSTVGTSGTADFRFAETLPTDPKALQVFHDMQRRLGSAKATGRATSGPERPSTATRTSLSMERPGTASRAAAPARTERFSSASLRTVHSMGLGYRPAVVTGFSAPEEEVALPRGGDAFRYSRLSQTSLSRLQGRLKLSGYPSRPFSAPVQMQTFTSSPTAWQQETSPPLSQSMSANSPGTYLMHHQPPVAVQGRIQSLTVMVPGGEDAAAADGHMPTVAEEATPTPTQERSVAGAEACAAARAASDAEEAGESGETRETGEVRQAGEVHEAGEEEAAVAQSSATAHEDGAAASAVSVSGSQGGASKEAAVEQDVRPGSASRSGKASMAAAEEADSVAQGDAAGQRGLSLDDSDEFVKEDRDDEAGSGGEDEVEQAIARVSRMGARPLQGSEAPTEQLQEEASGTTAQEAAAGDALQPGQTAGDSQQMDEGAGAPKVDEFETLESGQGGHGNALESLHGSSAEGAGDADGRGRMRMLLAEHEEAAAAAPAAGRLPAPVDDDEVQRPAVDEDAGIEEDEGNDDFFDSPQALSSAGSGVRPSSGMRPTSARPTSARPTSGRPASGRPSSGRPSSGRPSSGHGQPGLTASPGGSGLGRIGSAGMGVIPEHQEHQEHGEAA